MSKYSVGANFERAAKKKLEKENWFVLRSAGSHSVVDLFCFRDGEVRLVQCKVDGYLSPNEREQLLELAAQNGFCAYLVKRERRKLIFEELTSKKELNVENSNIERNRQSVLWTEGSEA